jgi:uncharacterized protein (TIGR02453 family)
MNNHFIIAKMKLFLDKDINLFSMLSTSLGFLSVLKENNYKEWFHANKDFYTEAKKEFEDFTNLLIGEIHVFDKEIGYPEAKNCIFRIFRDIRFSPNKTPYKTNFGAYIARGGSRKTEYGGYYFHLEPGNSMLAGGVWMPQPDVLKGIREEIYHNPDEFIDILNNKEFKKHFSGIDGNDVLKTAPKDFPKDWQHIHLLKFKSYTVSKALPEDVVKSDKVIPAAVEVFKAMLPMNKFFNRVIEDLR